MPNDEPSRMEVRPVPCPLCGMPPEVDTVPDDEGYYYVLCVNYDKGCPKESDWDKSPEGAVLAWNKGVAATIYHIGKVAASAASH